MFRKPTSIKNPCNPSILLPVYDSTNQPYALASCFYKGEKLEKNSEITKKQGNLNFLNKNNLFSA
jgi:hypothetical protein